MTAQGLPAYRQIADSVLGLIASGKLTGKFTVPELARETGGAQWAARKAAEYLAERGVIEPQQGSGYRSLISPDQAAAERLDDRSILEQVAELQKEMAEVRQRMGRIEASLATLTGRPRGGKREPAATAASGGRG